MSHMVSTVYCKHNPTFQSYSTIFQQRPHDLPGLRMHHAQCLSRCPRAPHEFSSSALILSSITKSPELSCHAQLDMVSWTLDVLFVVFVVSSSSVLSFGCMDIFNFTTCMNAKNIYIMDQVMDLDRGSYYE